MHDLKSPLAAVVGNLDLLEWRGDSRTLELVKRCKSGASRMLRMILDLLDVEAMEESRVTLNRETVDAAKLVEKGQHCYRRALNGKQKNQDTLIALA